MYGLSYNSENVSEEQERILRIVVLEYTRLWDIVEAVNYPRLQLANVVDGNWERYDRSHSHVISKVVMVPPSEWKTCHIRQENTKGDSCGGSEPKCIWEDEVERESMVSGAYYI